MKKFLLLSLMLLVLFGGRKAITKFLKSDDSAAPVQVETPNPVVEKPSPNPIPAKQTESISPELERVLSRAKSLEGAPYQAGGSSPAGFDCSGFVRYVYQQGDVVLPRSSEAMFLVGKSIQRQEARQGDLLFFTGSDANSAEVGHVAMVLESGEGQLLMIHASNRGVVIDDYYNMPYYQERYLATRRPYEK
jgi:cell wall-associated NlpC family hydrolase